jgi:hypothetical protein
VGILIKLRLSIIQSQLLLEMAPMFLNFLLMIIRYRRHLTTIKVIMDSVYKSMAQSSFFLVFFFSNSFFNSNNLYGPPVTLSYDGGSSSYSGLPSTLYTNQSGSSSLRNSQVHHEPQSGPQRRISTLSMMTDRPPMYYPNPILDEPTPVSSSSSNGNTNEKSGRAPRNPAYAGVAQPGVELTSTAIPGRQDDVNDWDSGYPQPLKFVPIA